MSYIIQTVVRSSNFILQRLIGISTHVSVYAEVTKSHILFLTHKKHSALEKYTMYKYVSRLREHFEWKFLTLRKMKLLKRMCFNDGIHLCFECSIPTILLIYKASYSLRNKVLTLNGNSYEPS